MCRKRDFCQIVSYARSAMTTFDLETAVVKAVVPH
jgi:hypothetical protein